jgi:hypothetical protein
VQAPHPTFPLHRLSQAAKLQTEEVSYRIKNGAEQSKKAETIVLKLFFPLLIGLLFPLCKTRGKEQLVLIM